MAKRKKVPPGRAGRSGRTGGGRTGGHAFRGFGKAYPVEFRLRAVREVLTTDATTSQVARVFGVAQKTLGEWIERWQEGGLDALVPSPPGGREKIDMAPKV